MTSGELKMFDTRCFLVIVLCNVFDVSITQPTTFKGYHSAFGVIDKSVTYSDYELQKYEQLIAGNLRHRFGSKKQEIVNELKSEEKREEARETTGGLTYIRWGRTKCNGNAAVLYKGYAAGNKYNVSGGGAELLCIHEAPQYINPRPGSPQVYKSYLYGVEYEMDERFHLFSTSNVGHLQQNDMPCVVCHVQTRSVQIMIPGRRTCPAGWTEEYWGYLVSEYTGEGSQRGSYNCLDNAPEATNAGVRNSNPRGVYMVEFSCEDLPCPPFVFGHEVTCVICSR